MKAYNSAGALLMTGAGGGGGGGGTFSGGFSTMGNTAGDTGVKTDRMVLVGSNNITLSGSTNAGSITISIIGAAGGGGGMAISAAGNSVSAGTVVFSNSNNVSFGMAGSTVTGTASFAQSNQQITLFATSNTTQSSTGTTNASSIIFNGAGIVSVGITGGSIVVSATQSNQAFSAAGGSSAFQTLSFSDNAQASFTNNAGQLAVTNVRMSWSATGNTTQSSTGTLNASSVILRGSNQVSVGISNGSIIVDATTAAQTNQQMTMFATGNTTNSSTGTTNASSIIFRGEGAVSVGITGGSIQISAPNTIAQTNQQMTLFATGNTTQSSTGTTNASSIIFRGAGVASVGITGGSIVISAPGSVFLLPNVEQPWGGTNFSISNMTMSLQNFKPKQNITATQMNFLMSLSGNSNSSGALTISIGIYTMSQSTLSLVSSNSRQVSWTSGSSTTSSNAYGGVSGAQYRTMTLGSWSVSAGDYVLGLWFRTTNDGTWRAYGRQGPTIVNAQETGMTQLYLDGHSTSSFSTAMPASINLTDSNYVRSGGSALQQANMILVGSF